MPSLLDLIQAIVQASGASLAPYCFWHPLCGWRQCCASFAAWLARHGF